MIIISRLTKYIHIPIRACNSFGKRKKKQNRGRKREKDLLYDQGKLSVFNLRNYDYYYFFIIMFIHLPSSSQAIPSDILLLLPNKKKKRKEKRLLAS